MSKLSNVLIGLGIIVLVLVIIKFRVAIISKLPISDMDKQKIANADPITNFLEDKDTDQLINIGDNKGDIDVKQDNIKPQISIAKIGLLGESNDKQNSVSDLNREFMEQDYTGITDKQIRDAMFGKATQETTVNSDGIVETSLNKDDKLFGATFKEVEKKTSQFIDKVLEPLELESSGKVFTKQDKSSASKVITVMAIDRFTGVIKQVDKDNIPQGYIIVGA